MNSANLYNEGAILELKKAHPCGSNKWKVIKVGIDYKLECCGCGHIVLIPRIELKKKVKNVISNN